MAYGRRFPGRRSGFSRTGYGSRRRMGRTGRGRSASRGLRLVISAPRGMLPSTGTVRLGVRTRRSRRY